MFKNIKIGTKITALVIIVVLISVLAVSLISFYLSRDSIEKRAFESINIVARLKAQKIDNFIDKIKASILFGTKLKAVQEKVAQAKDVQPEEETPLKRLNDTTGIKGMANNPAQIQFEEILNSIIKFYQINNIYITDKDGKVLYKTNTSENNQIIGRLFNDPDGNTIAVGKDSLYFSNIYQRKDKYFMLASAPILDAKEQVKGVMIYEIDMNYVYALVSDTTGLGSTGEIILAKASGNKVIYLNPLRYDKKAALKRSVFMGEKRGIPLQQAIKGRQGSGYDIDYRNQQVLATWRYIPSVGWGLVVKMDTSEVYAPVDRLQATFAVAGFSVIFISLIIGVIFSRVLINPLLSLRETVNLLSKGILPDKLPQTTQDEIGEMTGQLNELVEALKKTANFASRIGEGDFDASFQPISDQDTLGMSLLTMRDSIQMAAKRDDERNWIVTGLAEIGDILPSITNIQELGDLVCQYVTKKIGAVQGAFYVVNDEDENNLIIEMNASFAYNKKKYLQARFRFGEGLVGQAAIEKDTILRTEIPDDYMTITSGLLGDKKPKCILITPLITNEKVYGVLEFAGFERFGQREVQFVQEISEIIARTLFNIKVNENTRRLLEASQQMSRDLQMQQEVLRQNAEVMEATQEELRRANQKLEEQIEEVRKANDRIQLLLENASEVITIYEPNRTIRYISPSVEKILGYSAEEMIGIDDSIYIHPEGRPSFERMFEQLIANPDEKVTIQFSYKPKFSNNRIWLEATGTNLLADPAIQGIVINTRDITERRLAEKEQRMRGQMQALSENSPDLIIRISREGKIFYINPIIELYTGKNKEFFIGKDIRELELNDEIINSWAGYLREVATKNTKVSSEMSFPSILGERIMQVNGIPEYNDQNNFESMLLVSHDITERKIIELEIQATNKKIRESINYAKRIQEAILPSNDYIKAIFPDSFILYKPRDVVSGDFPWFTKKEHEVYIAAVDCTGHGVPGALISLIGYFLLNNIVDSNDSLSPAEILDKLDNAVVTTLKQDETDASTQDGMDIALCKINLLNKTLEYAGAHRPMLYLSNGELEEIKGNKFPIGGTQYKGKSNFTNNLISYKKGDSFYIFSDGYPDQFGGPKNKKLTTKKIKDVILLNQGKEMAEISNMLLQEFEAWRGNTKQTDDVLVIGIKF
ncbi:MAG: PAS domain S-box protein [Microscillaceae bacterium]|nr:PAS domain S-box protein [Microscillaceae bacterium]MDW8460609.1 PAS domain S-box protein [Cytophagales bacterium]